MLLKNFQIKFLEAITNPDQEIIFGFSSLRINIHRNNIKEKFTRAIKETYPLTQKLLGENFFKVLIKEYIKKYPTWNDNLNDYGKYFNCFVGTYSPLTDYVYLNEVIQFEWACHDIFFTADYSPLNIDLLKIVSPSDFVKLHFTLNPASRLMACHFPILRIIDLCNGRNDTTINLNEGGVNLLITRPNLELKLIDLPHSEFHFLYALHNNATLHEALESTLLIYNDFKLEKKLPYWIKNKTIVDFHL